ncbi:MAG: potassium/proton antiporter [Bacteroidetes bacterium]|nr:potassium/proton antiporter [Bacteroidota bacterium]MCW5894983.1 potassium/proton antiporter [Bacteroidota bacterium]
MISFEYILLVSSGLILISLAIAKISDNFGVPTLLLFLVVGMLAGSEGLGGIEFSDVGLARSIGTIALVLILFAGGLDTKWSSVRPVLREAGILATVGVLTTALLVGVFVSYTFGFSLLEGLLFGAVVSSTDAAAVFSLLRSRNVSLRGNLKPLLEFESGSNDPMAVFLTLGLIQVLTSQIETTVDFIVLFFYQMGFGAVLGFGLGKAMVFLLNRLKFSYQGFYPVFALAFAVFIFGITAVINGSGFLAVYAAGLVVGNSEIIQKRSLLRFFDGFAWLSQVGMFLTLGLLVFPSHVVSVVGIGLLASAVLMFVARPVSVFLSLAFTKFRWNEKALVSWVGLRGAVPIILATFPLLAGLPRAELMFNLVFFIVLTSTLLQGWSIPLLARILKVDAPLERTPNYPLEFDAPRESNTELVDLMVPYNSSAVGRTIVELGMPNDSLIVLIIRNEEFLVPSGGTVLESGDTILVLVNKQNLPQVRELLAEQRAKEEA